MFREWIELLHLDQQYAYKDLVEVAIQPILRFPYISAPIFILLFGYSYILSTKFSAPEVLRKGLMKGLVISLFFPVIAVLVIQIVNSVTNSQRSDTPAGIDLSAIGAILNVFFLAQAF